MDLVNTALGTEPKVKCLEQSPKVQFSETPH